MSADLPFGAQRSERGASFPVVEMYVCPGCGDAIRIGGSDFLYWKQEGPRGDGTFEISYVPRTSGADEVVVHECTHAVPSIWDVPGDLGPESPHPERN